MNSISGGRGDARRRVPNAPHPAPLPRFAWARGSPAGRGGEWNSEGRRRAAHFNGLLECRPVEPVVTLRGVSKRFGTLVALDDVDLGVRAGEIFVKL